MSRLVTKRITLAVLALFSSLSLLGPGWHCAFDGCVAEHADSCVGHGHGHAHAHQAKADCLAEDRGGAEDAHHFVPKASRHDHHCPICNFFAQAQWTSAGEPVEADAPCITISFRNPPVTLLVTAGSYRSRAPPHQALFA